MLRCIYQHLGGVHGNPLPKGVSVVGNESKTLLSGKESKGHIVLQVAADAPAVSRQQFCVMANVSLNFVMKATYASKPVRVSVVSKGK